MRITGLVVEPCDFLTVKNNNNVMGFWHIIMTKSIIK